MPAKDGKYTNATRCTGKAKTTGKQCKQPAVPGKDKCRYHGGRTPTKTGLYSKYENPYARMHIEAAQRLSAIQILEQTIPVAAGLLSLWLDTSIAFDSENYQATTALIGRITKAVSSYEKLTNADLRTGKLIVEHDYKDKSDGDLLDEIAELHKEANAITRAAATRKA